MAFTGNWVTNTFKTGLMNGSFNFTSGSFSIALYTNAATLDATTTVYPATPNSGEVVASGYVTGGKILPVSQTPTIGNQTGAATSYISFSNVSWTGAITARGALIYETYSLAAVCVLDFGSDKSSTNTFTVQFPAITNTSAIIRIS
jgi:hypothetical protein